MEDETFREPKSRGKSEKGVLTAVTLSHLAQHFYIGFSVLYPEIMADLTLNYTQLGIMTGATGIISGFLQMLWSLLNRYVSRRILLGLGNILMSAGCFVIGTANRFIDVIGGTILGGSGNSAQHPVGTSIVSHKFSREKVSGALSIHYGLGYVGNIISPIFLSLIAMSMGWRRAAYFLAIIPLITGLTVLFYLRGDKSALRSIQSGRKAYLWRDLKSVIHVKGAAFIIAAQAFVVGGTGLGVIVTYTPLFLKNELNVGTLETSVIYAIAVIGGVFGTIFIGQLASKVGNLKMSAAVVGTCSVLIFFLTFHNSFNFFLIPHLFIIGATSFAIGSLLQAHLASISTVQQRDILLGLYFTLGFGVSSIWTTLTGFVIDFYGSFNPAWLLRAILGAIAFFLIILASRRSIQSN